MKHSWVFLLILASCFGGGEQLLVQGPSVKKQRQKIVQLQKKLEIAEKEQQKIESVLQKLIAEIDEAQLALIRRQIDDVIKAKERSATLFMEEREALYRMIQTGSSQIAFEAQIELDRILQIITESSDEERRVF
jgi:t-SNARE complex subunit (syntaxin)